MSGSGLPLIVNPSAGGGRAAASARRAAGFLRSRDRPVEVLTTRHRGEATDLAAAAVRRGVPVVVACGGDGTMHEVVQALAGTGTALGLIPAGRGNDLAAALRIPLDPVRAAARLLDGYRRRIDVGTVNGIRFVTVAAAGFDAEVGLRTRAGLWRHAGRVGYMAAVAGAAFGYRARAFRLTGDFGIRDRRLLLCAVSNTGLYGGGIRIAPGSSPDDGLLDCCLVGAASPWRLLRLFPRAYRGGHVGQPEVEMFRSGTLRVETDVETPLIADGEPAGRTPAEFGMEAGAMEVIVGRMDGSPDGRTA